jgi:hypothetical protein
MTTQITLAINSIKIPTIVIKKTNAAKKMVIITAWTGLFIDAISSFLREVCVKIQTFPNLAFC